MQRGCEIVYAWFLQIITSQERNMIWLLISQLITKMSEKIFKFNAPMSQVYTNSLLHLTVPQKYKNLSCSFRWIPQNKKMHAYINILTRFDINKISNNDFFQCTPLDYGLTIIGRIVTLNKGQYEVIQQVKFGPVMAQPQIESYIRDKKYQQIKICFFKNVNLESRIKIISGQKIQGKNSKIGIKITSKQFNFQISFDQSTRVPSNNSFFKFYNKQQNCLGISICHQHSQLLEKLKQTKYAENHFGLYLKIQFPSRMQRDAFLYELLQNIGICIFDKPMIITLNKQLMTTNEEKIKQPVDKSSGEKKKQIDEEIYQLLYDNQQESNDDFSFDLADAELLLSSKRFESMGKNSITQIQCKKELQKVFSAQNNFNKIFQNQEIDQIIFNNDQKKMIQNQSLTNLNDKPYDETIQISYPVLNEKQHFNQNHFVNTITDLTNQVKKLLKQNRRLTQENKKLKDQNIKLRYRQVKNNFSKTKPQKFLKKNKSSKQILVQKDKSKSISPNPNQLKNSKKEITSKIEKIQKKCIDKSDKQNSFKATSSTGSILIHSPASKYSDRTSKNYVSLSSVTNRDLVKMQQIHRSNEVLQSKITYGVSKNSQTCFENIIKNPQSNSLSRSPSPQIKLTNFGSISTNFININLRR